MYKRQEEILYDPQTSGGLMISVSQDQALGLLDDLKENQVFAKAIGEIGEKQDKSIIVE